MFQWTKGVSGEGVWADGRLSVLWELESFVLLVIIHLSHINTTDDKAAYKAWGRSHRGANQCVQRPPENGGPKTSQNSVNEAI